jgi:hypothetical protein
MKRLLRNLFHRMIAALREHWQLSLETMALHHQLGVLERSGKRPRYTAGVDREYGIIWGGHMSGNDQDARPSPRRRVRSSGR